jgi:hypothetical protein
LRWCKSLGSYNIWTLPLSYWLLRIKLLQRIEIGNRCIERFNYHFFVVYNNFHCGGCLCFWTILAEKVTPYLNVFSNIKRWKIWVCVNVKTWKWNVYWLETWITIVSSKSFDFNSKRQESKSTRYIIESILRHRNILFILYLRSTIILTW